MAAYIGIDPGKQGAISCVDGSLVETIRLSETVTDVIEWLREHDYARFAFLENVHSSPQMGVKSVFTFGQGFGTLIGVLYAVGIPFELVNPQKWQKAMGCMTKGDKNVSKAAAQRLFPRLKITHADADSLLIAEYCRRIKGDN